MAKKIRLPKKIAGIRVPKRIRKSSLLHGLLDSPVGRHILAEALTAGAAAGAAVLVRERKDVADGVEAGAKRGVRMAALVGETVQSAADAMLSSVTTAARSMLSDNDDEDEHGGKHSEKFGDERQAPKHAASPRH